MLDITIITIGKVKEKSLAQSCEAYIKRLSPYAKINIVELKAQPFSESTRARAKIEESARLSEVLEKYKGQANIWLLAEQGKMHDSFSFAEFLEVDNRPLVFVIAGSLGWSEAILKTYRNHLSLSKLTMPHELARLVLYEQLYRAVTISKGKTYHY